ncbi:MAG: hypothetical protein ACYC7L_15940 [Nitrospirota bacterium]
MILNPAIIALLVSSIIIAVLVLYASWYGARIIAKWDLRSGSGLQLDLERRTYLISTVIAYVFGFQLISLFLLVYTADSLCTLFAGAMCAAGTFQANAYGYPLLLLKVLNFLLAGLWLILNRADNQAYDYPLIRKKYSFLLVIVPLIVLESVLQVLYFQGLRPDVITSCCGSLFSADATSVAADLAALPEAPMRAVFFLSVAVSLALGSLVLISGRGGYAFAISQAAVFLIGIASVLSFISPAVYELPTHHCPFCLLQKEYQYIGYLFYALLFGGSVAGMGVGILTPFRSIPSLAVIVPGMQKRLSALSLTLTAGLGLLTVYILMVSNLHR